MASGEMGVERMERATAPVSEEDLRALAKCLSTAFRIVESERCDEEKVKLMEHVLAALFDTATSSAISQSHRTAACNALCGTIEKCLASACNCLVNLVCSDTLFHNLHLLYFDRYYGAKEKSMKQVLSTIVKLIAKTTNLNPSTTQWSRRSLKHIFQILFRSQERSKAKPALHALQQYICKGLISSFQVINTFQQWHRGPVLAPTEISDYTALQRLLEGVLEWVPFGDIAPSVGLFITSFLKILPEDPLVVQMLWKSEIPAWVEPLMHSISKHSSHIEAFQTYVYPGLFQHGALEYWGFLQYLNVEMHLGLHVQGDRVRNGGNRQHDASTEHLVLFSALHIGKELGLVLELETGNATAIQIRDDFVCIPEAVLTRLLDHSSKDIRLSGLALLLTSTRSTKPYTPTVLQALTRSLPHFYAEADPNFRGEVQSLVQVLINRLRVISAALYRASTLRHGQSRDTYERRLAAGLVESHKRFVTQFLRFLTFELHPAASYQRHISALKSLMIILKSGLDQQVDDGNLSRLAKLDAKWLFHIDVVNPALRRALLDTLQNPFDDVRQIALEVLKLANVKCNVLHATVIGTASYSIMERAQRLMIRSGRADHSDCVARLHDLHAHMISSTVPYHVVDKFVMRIIGDLLSSIEIAVEVANTKLSIAVASHPIHGYLTSLRYIVEQGLGGSQTGVTRFIEFRGLLDRLFGCLVNIWNCVKPMLCNDAPEGFIPHDIEMEPVLTSKDVLSFAWRALKESSLLLRALIGLSAIDAVNNNEKVKTTYLVISGDLCFTQLAELRHRGAFSTVAQTFAALCRKCVASHDFDVQGLVIEWYKRALGLIEQRGSVITRRSAGIPALIVAILAAEPRLPRLKDVIVDLQNIAARPVRPSTSSDAELPQVHALNSLKAIFNNSILGEQCECHVVEVMRVASTCLGSTIWSIRNCGIMVFRGLIDRILGSNESLDDNLNSSPSRISHLSYERYPGLLELVYHLLELTRPALKTSVASCLTEVDPVLPVEPVFTVLDLLRRAPPPYSHLLDMRRLILPATGSSHWHIRDLAARTFAASLCKSEIFEVINNLLETSCRTNNESHGRLLCIRYALVALIFDNVVADKGAASSTIARTTSSDPINAIRLSQCVSLAVSEPYRFLGDNTCDSIKEAYLQILNLFGQLVLRDSRAKLENLALGSISDALRTMSLLTARLPRQSSFVERELQIFNCLVYIITAPSERPPGDSVPLFSRFKDAEISTSVLRSLNTLLYTAHSKAVQLFVESLSRLLQNIYNSRVFRAGEVVLLDAIDVQPTLQAFQPNIILDYFCNLEVGQRLLTEQYPNALEHDIWAWGWSLCAKLQDQTVSTAVIVQQAKLWIEVVQRSLGASNDVALRSAAIRSMKGFATGFQRVRKLPRSLLLKWALAVYDSLNDDDDDLRKLAAEVCFLLLKRSLEEPRRQQIVVPLVAAKMLCNHLIQQHSRCPELLMHAVGRLIQHDPRNSQYPRSAFEDLQDITRDETLLFVVEKQNLYVDEIREAKIWSKILQSMEPNVGPPCSINRLVEWATNGLDALISISQGQDDGALGWASNPRTFVLGIRIIRAAETILLWRTRSTIVKVTASTVLAKLQKFHDVGREKAVHELWMGTVERVLQKVLKRRLEKVVIALKKLPIRIC